MYGGIKEKSQYIGGEDRMNYKPMFFFDQDYDIWTVILDIKNREVDKQSLNIVEWNEWYENPCQQYYYKQ
jgi:hypothetical protein